MVWLWVSIILTYIHTWKILLNILSFSFYIFFHMYCMYVYFWKISQPISVHQKLCQKFFQFKFLKFEHNLVTITQKNNAWTTFSCCDKPLSKGSYFFLFMFWIFGHIHLIIIAKKSNARTTVFLLKQINNIQGVPFERSLLGGIFVI